ncbi:MULTISPECIES: hypothetical protein [unclassified Pseudomonas]|jgi:hypothetical protein|uniref:hypothetical protein n=1 Tax=unclassified Pseudomonas TaxID=196821 RepID=UPI00255785DF|nr:hypothetical protein [Pseudomonas sp. efr-133-TYG-103a]
MTDPLDKATSKAPPTLGEGCLSRYDVDALSPDDGTEFEGAAQLWEQLKANEKDDGSGGSDPQ